ncbi:MAG: hypothetical protein SGJ17_09650 [Hyphomicrobiales bacterium]|nr:hypothetical protein [Hyphomicrobiales bacterium]
MTNASLGATATESLAVSQARAEHAGGCRDEAAFQSILDQSDMINQSALGGSNGNASHRGSFDIDTLALSAADDSWVNVVAKVEQLQRENLPQEKRELLILEIAENWRTFQAQSGSLASQLEIYKPAT